ncbi:hypothetical protein FRC00_003202 [Tulasnella sp. 408]|nr:hypothetical protein FRC00_003202 [Tulasnella sp. 408]
MKYGDLKNYIAETKPSFDERLSLVRDLTDGLAYLHGQAPPIRHGDLKPANVLVNPDRRALLADFGLSKAVDTGPTGFTTGNDARGTIRYSSPEVLLQGTAAESLSNDIWSWGCLTLEALTDMIPFSDIKAEPQLVLALALGRSPSETNIALSPEWLKDLLADCWSRQPEARPTAVDCLRITESSVLASNADRGGEFTTHVEEDHDFIGSEIASVIRRRDPSSGTTIDGRPKRQSTDDANILRAAESGRQRKRTRVDDSLAASPTPTAPIIMRRDPARFSKSILTLQYDQPREIRPETITKPATKSTSREELTHQASTSYSGPNHPSRTPPLDCTSGPPQPLAPGIPEEQALYFNHSIAGPSPGSSPNNPDVLPSHPYSPSVAPSHRVPQWHEFPLFSTNPPPPISSEPVKPNSSVARVSQWHEFPLFSTDPESPPIRPESVKPDSPVARVPQWHEFPLFSTDSPPPISSEPVKPYSPVARVPQWHEFPLFAYASPPLTAGPIEPESSVALVPQRHGLLSFAVDPPPIEPDLSIARVPQWHEFPLFAGDPLRPTHPEPVKPDSSVARESLESREA